MTINDCIILLKKNVKNKYAQAYLNEIADAIENGGTEGLCIQLNYILANSKKWTGEEATQTKKFIRDWIKKKGKSEN